MTDVERAAAEFEGAAAGPETELVCSAKGCRASAVQVIEWNNPRLHSPERRKTWLACADHEQGLRRFLDARGFYRDTRPAPGL